MELALPKDQPKGPPVTYGPQRGRQMDGGEHTAINPFWSEKVKDEVTIRALRPHGLPRNDAGPEASASTRTGMEEGSMNAPEIRDLLTMFIQQNNQLKRELDELKGHLHQQSGVTQPSSVNTAESQRIPGAEKVIEPRSTSMLQLEDGKPDELNSEVVGSGNGGDWTTPPGSVPPTTTGHRKSPVVGTMEMKSSQETSGWKPEDTMQQQPALGQVMETMAVLMKQLAAAQGNGALHNGPGQPGGDRQGSTPGQGDGNGSHQGGWQGHLPTGSGGYPPFGGHGNGQMPGGGGGIPLGPTIPTSADMGWIPSFGESIRTVDLPQLPSIKEGELGGAVLGDWLTLVAPIMKDLSVSSGAWWTAITRGASDAYQRWLRSDPVQRLHIAPLVPTECTGLWTRLEQRGQSMLLCALPEGLKSEVLASRSTNTVEILYRIYTRYQPGGLGEKALPASTTVGRGEGTVNFEWVPGADQSLEEEPQAGSGVERHDTWPNAADECVGQDEPGGHQSFNSHGLPSELYPSSSDGRHWPYFDSSHNVCGRSLGRSREPLPRRDSDYDDCKGQGHGWTLWGQCSKRWWKGENNRKGRYKEREGSLQVLWDGGWMQEGCWAHVPSWLDHDRQTWSMLELQLNQTFQEGVHRQGDGCRQWIHGVWRKRKEGWRKGKGERWRKCQSSLEESGKGWHPAKSWGDQRCSSGRSPWRRGGPGSWRSRINGRSCWAPPRGDHPSQNFEGPSTSSYQAQQPRGCWWWQDTVGRWCNSRTPHRQGHQGVGVCTGGAGGVSPRISDSSPTPVVENPPFTVTSAKHSATGNFGRDWVCHQVGGNDLRADRPLGMHLGHGAGGSLSYSVWSSGFGAHQGGRALLRGAPSPIGSLLKDDVKHLEELRRLFPEVPEEILVRILPTRSWSGAELPWNRRVRRRLRKARQIVLHLFSGDTEKFWKSELEAPGREVLCVDVEIDRRQNLLKDDIYSFLLDLADTGTLDAVIGGPPCRTASRLRYVQPGPPPLRSRIGPERFGLKDLDEVLLQRVRDDTVLWLRQYYIYHRAKDARAPLQKKTLYLKEQPEDPEKYLSPSAIATQRYPSYWAFPEWHRIKELNGFIEVSFDQGPTGHIKRKPTTLGGNILELQDLHGMRGPGTSREGFKENLPIEEKIRRSKAWASWSDGLKKAIAIALRRELNQGLELEDENIGGKGDGIKKMSLEDWKRHLKNDHQPYYRGCRTCLEACGQARHHRKVVTPDSYTLGIDLAGPFKKGTDQLGDGRYMLVGCYTLPTTMDGKGLHIKDDVDGEVRREEPGGEATRSAAPGGVVGCGSPRGEGVRSAAPPDLEGGIFNDPPEEDPIGDDNQGDQEVDPLEVEDDPQEESPKDEKDDDSQKWKDLIQEEQNFKVSQLTFMEILPDRRAASILEGVSRIYTRLRYLNLPLRRLHSDRAGELRSKSLRKWALDRGILRTYTGGDDYKTNGRAEAEVNMLKKATRTLLKSSGSTNDLWPLAARHGAERRLRRQLEHLGLPMKALLPFGATGFAKQRIWEEKYQDWKLTRKQVKIYGPDVSMSASMTGYFVQDDTGKFFHTADVIQPEDQPEDLSLPEVHLGEMREPGKRMRIYGKSTVMGRLQVPAEEAEQRRLRGLHLLMEELDLQDSMMVDYAEPREDEEQAGTDRFVRALLADVENLAEGLEETEKECQAQETERLQTAVEGQGVFLQTRMYSLSEVRAELEEWKESMWSEFTSLTEETGAVRVITESHAEQLRREAEKKGILYERIPGKAIFSRKAGSGRRKCRACACGNYMSQRSLTDTYAGGTGAAEVRCILRKGGLEKLSAVTLDIKTAFLRAPRDHSREIVVVQPPQIFILAGIAEPGTLWLVDRALYGLTTSPKEWTQFRNERMVKFTWDVNGSTFAVQRTEDQDIWKIIQCNPVHRCEGSGGERPRAASTEGCEAGCGSPRGEGVRTAASTPKVIGYFVTYVDDVLAVGDRSVLEGFCQRMQQEWEVGTPEWLEEGGKAVRFLGMELELRDGVYRVHQQSFVQNLLEKYPHEQGKGLSTIKTPEEEESVTPQEVQEAQKQTGELLWLAGRTRPDICYGVSLMSQFATKRPKGVQAIGKEIRCYLRANPDLALEYGPLEDGDFGEDGSQRRARHANLVEVYTDASFASSNLRSVSGVVGFFAGAPVFWITCRQSFVTLSTAESELMSMLEGLTALRCIKSIVDMLQPTPSEGRMFSDSMAGISIVSGTTGSWRTRHLRIRAQGLHEAIERGETTLEHQSGKILVADGMTKQLQGNLLRHFVQALKMTAESRQPVQVKKMSTGGGEIAKRLQDSLGLLVAAASVMVSSAETTGTEGAMEEEGSSSWIFLMVAVAAILVLVDMCGRFGFDYLKNLCRRGDELKVKLLDDAATLPTRGTEGSAGLSLCSIEDVRIASGDYALIRTGIAVELPYGTYGRIATRSALATKGLEVGAGVVDRDFRGEIKVLIHNRSGMEFWVRTGDQVAQLIVEKVMEVQVTEVENLTATTRGVTSLSHTNVADPSIGITSFSSRGLRKVGRVIGSYEGGSSATNGEPTSLSSGSFQPSPMPLNPASSQRMETSQPSSLSQNLSLSQNPSLSQPMETTLMSSTSMKSSTTKDELVEGLKTWKSCEPMGPTMAGMGALTGHFTSGNAEHFLKDRQWFGSATISMESLVNINGVAGGYWPLLSSLEMYQLVLKKPQHLAPDDTKVFQLSAELLGIVRTHSQPRLKIYDTEDGGNEIRRPMQLTLAWLENDRKDVVVCQRRGRRSAYLPIKWVGHTIHLQWTLRAWVRERFWLPPKRGSAIHLRSWAYL